MKVSVVFDILKSSDPDKELMAYLEFGDFAVRINKKSNIDEVAKVLAARGINPEKELTKIILMVPEERDEVGNGALHETYTV